MSTYYDGDLEKDLDQLKMNNNENYFSNILNIIGKEIGYGRTQQIVQVLWAKDLRESGYHTTGALLPNDLEK